MRLRRRCPSSRNDVRNRRERRPCLAPPPYNSSARFPCSTSWPRAPCRRSIAPRGPVWPVRAVKRIRGRNGQGKRRQRFSGRRQGGKSRQNNGKASSRIMFPLVKGNRWAMAGEGRLPVDRRGQDAHDKRSLRQMPPGDGCPFTAGNAGRARSPRAVGGRPASISECVPWMDFSRTISTYNSEGRRSLLFVVSGVGRRAVLAPRCAPSLREVAR